MSSRLLAVATIALLVSVGATLIFAAGLAGLAYGALFVAAAAPGLPLGFALFGRGHGCGWIAGLLLGYATTSLAWWAVVFLQRTPPTAVVFFMAWAAAAVAAAGLARLVRSPALTLPPWTRRETLALLLLLLLVPALVSRPFARLASTDSSGSRLYRAYFIADFVWHTALTAELAKEAPRPRNPFMASQPVHYYWTYFRIPATLAAHAGFRVEDALKLNAICTALLFVSAIFIAAWTALPQWPFIVGAAVLLTVVAPSIEGLAAIVDLARRGHPLAELRDLNIDAIAAWAFKGLRIDDLPRAMWYTPQHSMSLALGLIALPVSIAGGLAAAPSAVALAGCALAGSFLFNPLIGLMLCGAYGLPIAVDAARGRSVAPLARQTLAVLPVLAALGWATLNQVGDGAADVLHFGFSGPARNATVLTLLLSFGPILVPMALGLWPGPRKTVRHLLPAITGVGLAILLMHFVTLTSDEAWVGFRGGQIFFVAAPALVAAGILRLWTSASHKNAVILAAGVLAIGLPTTVVDTYNAQDVTNRGVCCGQKFDFHWTVAVTADEQEALDWIRTQTTPDSVVQMEPTVRGRETWCLIPALAERRMATGNALPLLPVPGYGAMNEVVRQIYASDDATAAWRAATSLGIQYLYVDATERGAYPAVQKFDAYPSYFERAFNNSEVSVYEVRASGNR